MRSLALLCLLPLLGGCTAARANYMILTADQAYRAALAEGAEDEAVYEITLAGEYLKKAQEEVGYSQYGAVDELCQRSISFSQSAQKKASGTQVPDASPGVVPEERANTPAAPTGPDLDIDLDEP